MSVVGRTLSLSVTIATSVEGIIMKKNTKRTRVEVLKQADGIKKDKSDTAAKDRGYLYIHSCTAIFTASASLILILMVQSVHLFAVSSAFYMVYCANHRGNQGLGC